MFCFVPETVVHAVCVSIYSIHCKNSFNKEPLSAAKERPTPHDSLEQRCTNHSSQVMPLIGSQLQNSYRSYNDYCSNWSMTEKSKFQFRTSLVPRPWEGLGTTLV